MVSSTRMSSVRHQHSVRSSTTRSAGSTVVTHLSFPVVLGSLVLLLSLLTTTTTTFLYTNAAPTPLPAFPPRVITSPFIPAPMPDYDRSVAAETHWLNFIGGINGTANTIPGQSGLPFKITQTINGLPAFVGTVVLPNSADDDRGCTLTHNKTDLGDTFVGKVVLMRRGSCTFGTKAAQAAALGAAGAILYSCSPDVCRPSPVTAVFSEVLDTPVYFLHNTDGVTLATQIKAYNAQQIRWQNPVLKSQDLAANVEEQLPLKVQALTTGPIDPAERAALSLIISQFTPFDLDPLRYGHGYAWTMENMNNASFDPCLSRLLSVWCEDGHIVDIAFNPDSMSVTSAHPAGIPVLSAWANFTKLRAFDLTYGAFGGAIPEEMCTLTDLRSFIMGNQAQGTGLIALPACFNTLTKLKVIYANTNKFASLPSLTGLSQLRYIDFGSNQLTAFNQTIVQDFPALQYLTLPNNNLVTLPQGVLKGHSLITYADFSNNGIQQVLPIDAFDGCSAMTDLILENNMLSGPLPTLKSCISLQNLRLSKNKFNGTCTQPNWVTDLQNVTTYSVAHNQLTSPCRTNILESMTTLDLSYNLLTARTGNYLEDDNVAAFVTNQLPQSIVNVDFSHNLLAGRWWSGYMDLFLGLQVLQMSNNLIQRLPFDLFNMPTTSIDFSNNDISLLDNNFQDGPPASTLLYFDLRGNPKLQLPVDSSGQYGLAMPTWMSLDDGALVTAKGVRYSCPTLRSASTVLMQFLVDPQFTRFALCSCATGTYPAPALPVCLDVPDQVTPPFAEDKSASPGGDDQIYSKMSYTSTDVDLLRKQDLQLWNSSSASITGLTDDTYGAQRAIPGANIKWLVNATRFSGNASKVGETIIPTNPLITVFLYVNVDSFSSNLSSSASSNLLSIYSGSGTQGQQQFTLSGKDTALLSAGEAAYASAVATVAAVDTGDNKKSSSKATSGTLLPTLIPFSRVALFVIQVLHPLATVQFQSRDPSGQHFLSRFAFSGTCPPNYRPTQQFKADSYTLSGTYAACEPVPFCTQAAVGYNITECDTSDAKQTLTYAWNQDCLTGVVAPSGSQSSSAAYILPQVISGTGLTLPEEETLRCNHVPIQYAGSGVLLALLALTLLLCVILLAYLAMIHLQFLWRGDVKKKAHPLIIFRLTGVNSFSLPLASALCAGMGIVQLGVQSDSKCATSLSLFILTIAFMHSLCLVACYTMHQLLTRPLFTPDDPTHLRYTILAQVGIILTNSVLLLLTGAISPKSYSHLTTLYMTADAGAMLPVDVCSGPSLWFLLVLCCINALWWLPVVWMTIRHYSQTTNSLDELKRMLAIQTQKDLEALPPRIKQQLKTLKLRAIQSTSVFATMLISTLLLIWLVLTWVGLMSTPKSAFLLFSMGSAVCLICAFTTLVSFFGISLYMYLQKGSRKRSPKEAAPVPQSTTAKDLERNKEKERGARDNSRSSHHAKDERDLVSGNGMPGSPQHVAIEMSRRGNNKGHAQRDGSTNGSSRNSKTYSWDDDKQNSDWYEEYSTHGGMGASLGGNGNDYGDASAGSFTDAASIMSDPITRSALRAYASRTFNLENLDFVTAVRHVFTLIHDQVTDPIAKSDADENQMWTNLPGVSIEQLYMSGAGNTGGAVVVGSLGSAVADANKSLVPTSSPIMTRTESTSDNGMLRSSVASIGSVGSVGSSSSSGSNMSAIPVFGEMTLLDSLLHQRILRISGVSHDQRPFRLQNGELLWILFEIYNTFLMNGSTHEINVADGMRKIAKQAVIQIIQLVSGGPPLIVQPTPLHGPSRPGSPRLPPSLIRGPSSSSPSPDTTLDAAGQVGPASPSHASPEPSLSPVMVVGSGEQPPEFQLSSMDSVHPQHGEFLSPTSTTLAGLFHPPAAYLPLRILRLPATSATSSAVHAALLPGMKEVMRLVQSNLIHAFRSSPEGEAANHVLRLYERLEQTTGDQRKAVVQKLLRMMAREHGRSLGGEDDSAPSSLPPFGADQLTALLHG